MNQSERDELLIRVDERTAVMEKFMTDEPKCSAMKEKVLMHDKLFWLGLAASIGAFVKSFWGGTA